MLRYAIYLKQNNSEQLSSGKTATENRDACPVFKAQKTAGVLNVFLFH